MDDLLDIGSKQPEVNSSAFDFMSVSTTQQSQQPSDLLDLGNSL
jgi:hypothetical protein